MQTLSEDKPVFGLCLNSRRRIQLAISALVLAVTAASRAAEPHPTALRCEFQDSPLGVDRLQPRLSWILSAGDDQRGQRQTAYRILAASSADQLKNDNGDLWDSGQVRSDQSFLVPYEGQSLNRCQRVFWKVRTWDQDNKPSRWSEPAQWTTGIMRPDDWKAKWIGGAIEETIDGQPKTHLLVLRRSFTPKAPVKSAIINICGLGQYELSLNGERVSDELLAPGWTNYRKTCLYNTYDVTDKLVAGENALGVMLGNGMYNVPKTKDIGRYTKFTGTFGQPKVIAQLDIAYADGTAESIITDGQWRTAASPIVFSNTFGGEDYDARLEQPGWNGPGFNDAQWTAAVQTEGPGGGLFGLSRSAPPIKLAQVFTPVNVTNPKPGIYVYDLAQNCALMPQITVHGKSGATVKLIPGELLEADGTVSQLKLSAGLSSLSYTLRGEAEETWGPRFFYYGSRYIQVEGAVPAGAENPDGLPVVRELKGRFVTSTSPAAGEFSCSSELFNRTATLIRWAMRNNMQSVLTDCPHREKLGWLEQDHLVGSSLMYNFNVQSLFNKICDDIADSQTADGLVPCIAPEYTVFKGDFRDSPEWGSAAVLIPWQLYQWYGDRAVLEEHYDTMRRYVDYLSSRAENHIVSHGLGDWFDLGPGKAGPSQLTPKSLTATAFYFRNAQLVSQFAKLLGHNEEAAKYAALTDDIRAAFNRSLYDAQQHTYGTGSQTSNAIPLVFGLVPSADRPAVVASLVADVRQHDNALTAGDIGFHYLVRALADAGRSDVIFDMNSGSDRPGYGYILAKGATALTESWDGTHSQDHFMLGHIMEWFYSDLAGIQCDPTAVAFKRIIIKPTPVGDITWTSAAYDCPYGKIKTAWKLDGGKFNLDVTIPPGTTATVWVPSDDRSAITESGTDVAHADAVRLGKRQGAYTPIEVESGQYHFQSTLTAASH